MALHPRVRGGRHSGSGSRRSTDDDHQLRGGEGPRFRPVADALLAKLDGTGVVGLGLTVGALRRPFAAQKPLLAPADWHGINFRTFNSPVQAETITALGAVPVNAGFEWTDEILAGRLRGAEFDVAQYAANGLTDRSGSGDRRCRALAQGSPAKPEPPTLRVADRPATAMGTGRG